MNCEDLLQRAKGQLTDRIRINLGERNCQFELPLLELNGDTISVYFEQSEDKIMIHDGGRISGILFSSGPGSTSLADKRLVESILKDAGLERDPNRGIVSIDANEESLSYRSMEIGRTVAIVSAVIPSTTPRRRRQRRLGPRVAQKVVRRLVDEGLMDVISPGMNVKGVTDQDRHVDFSYTIPSNPLKMQPETNVYVLTLDLDVINPITKANNSLTTATDLGGIAVEEHDVNVKIVHSAGSANGNAERAKRLIMAAAEKRLFEQFSWDDPGEQNHFLEVVGQEVAPLLGK